MGSRHDVSFLGTQRLKLRALADAIQKTEAPKLRTKFSALFEHDDRAIDLATLLAAAYPAMEPTLVARNADVRVIAHGSKSYARRDARAFRSLAPAPEDPLLGGKLRAFAFREKIRIAARELFLEPSADIDVTARELSDLADVCVEVALREALSWAKERYGLPEKNSISVLGMGKLGGRELNAGSDVDLLFAYDNDDQTTGTSAHEVYTRVAQRMTATLDEATEDGIVWRVDLRLRPEGARGPLVNSHAALERYYESWGRTWERAALVRARAIAGDLALGEHVLETLGPFIWRREVNPGIAAEMGSLLNRARVDRADDAHHAILHFEGNKRIGFSREVQGGLGFERGEAAVRAAAGGDGGEGVAAHVPQLIGEATTVGVAGAIDLFVVDLGLGAGRLEDGVEEFQVAVTLIAGGFLPAVFQALRVGESAGGGQTLQVDDDSLRPLAVQGEGTRRLLSGAAMTVEDEDEWRGLGSRAGGNREQAAAGDAVNLPGLFDERGVGCVSVCGEQKGEGY